MNGVVREGQTYTGESLVSRYASFVKLPHTLFALPFAGVGAVFASYRYSDRMTIARIGWIVLAFTAARFAAMGFNRIVDAHYDHLNPRTRMRELPSGKLTRSQAILAVTVASVLFVFASWQLNALCGWLSFVALGWVFFYSFTKRFTQWAHNVLGFALGIAPVGAYLAIAGAWTVPWYTLVVLAAAVMFWVGGFDMIYALQDIDFDRTHKLHSVPARHGFTTALRMARLFHVISVLLFILSGQLMHTHALYWAGIAGMASMLAYEHMILRGQTADTLDLRKVDRAFFYVNIGVSTTVFVFTLLDRVLLA